MLGNSHVNISSLTSNPPFKQETYYLFYEFWHGLCNITYVSLFNLDTLSMQSSKRASQNFFVHNMHFNWYDISLYHLIDPMVHNIQFVLLIKLPWFLYCCTQGYFRSHYAYLMKDAYVTIDNNLLQLGSP